MKFKLIAILSGLMELMSFSSCGDDKSYADLLKDERFASNSFLSNYEIIDEIPSDTLFEVGENAPYYKIDPDGNVYMQVLIADSKENRPKTNQPVYFRFMRLDLLYLYTSGVYFWEGNAENMMADPTFFLYDNYTLDSSSYYGYGLQMPLKYLGVNSKVNLLVKSQYGFSNEISNVIPYLYNITYYPSMIGGGDEE